MKKLSLPQLLTVEEVAEALAVHPKTVRRRIADGAIRAYRIGRNVRVSLEDFRAYVALQRL